MGLRDLTVLDLSGNELSGELLPFLGSLSALTFVDLLGNDLTGGLPASLGSLSNLVSLNLSQNWLGGAVPSSFSWLEGVDVRLKNNIRCDNEYAVNYENIAPLTGAMNPPSSVFFWQTYFMDFECGIDFDYRGWSQNTMDDASNLYASIECPNTVDFHLDRSELLDYPTPPWMSLVHFRDFTTCNINGQIKLQALLLPAARDLATWLQYEAGAGGCVVDMDTLEKLNVSSSSSVDADLISDNARDIALLVVVTA